MKKILLVMRNEIRAVVMRRSFILSLLAVPAISMIFLLIVSSSTGSGPQTGAEASNPVAEFFEAETKPGPEAYVDYSGLIQKFPSQPSGTTFRAFQDESAARMELLNNRISGLYVVSADFLETGEVVYYRQDYNPISGMDQSEAFENLLTFNLLNGSEELASRLRQPLVIRHETYLQEDLREDRGEFTQFFVPYIVMMLFFGTILGNASLLLNSISNEKQNRVMEVLLVSMTPVQMFTGKIIALGLVGLFQTTFWTLTGMLALNFGGQSMSIPLEIDLPPSMLGWGMLFFLLGYALYGSLMAGIGALAPDIRESSQTTTMVTFPLVIPLFLLNAFIQDPNGWIALALTFFPFTTPVAIMARLAAVEVPWWQCLLAALEMALTVVLVIRGVSGLFRGQRMFSGQTLKPIAFLKALIGKA